MFPFERQTKTIDNITFGWYHKRHRQVPFESELKITSGTPYRLLKKIANRVALGCLKDPRMFPRIWNKSAIDPVNKR